MLRNAACRLTGQGRGRLFGVLCSLVFIIPAGANGWNAVPLGDDDPDVGSWQSYFEPDSHRGKGHNWMTNLAVKLLKKRGLLEYITWDDMRYIHHGLDFADHPWRGPALHSDETAPSVRDADGVLFGDGRVLWNPDYHFDREIHNPIGENYYKVHTFWARGFHRFRTRERHYANPTFVARWWANTLGAYDAVEHVYCADNLLHYYKEPSETELVTVLKTARRITNGEKIFSNGPVGSAEYGSVLYQLAQRFWPNYRFPEPKLTDLPYVKRAGTIHMNPLTKAFLTADLPDTYLGGNPFICAPPHKAAYETMVAEQRRIFDKCMNRRDAKRARCVEKSLRPYMNTCETGDPTWPNFVPKVKPANAAAFRKALLTNAPGKNKNTALVYLGWALHLLQDTAVPHHAKRWVSKNHNRLEEELDKRLKTRPGWGIEQNFEKRLKKNLSAIPKKSGSICHRLGFQKDVTRNLNAFSKPGHKTTGVKSVFHQTALRAQAGAKDKWDEEMFMEAIDNAVLSSLKLLICFGNVPAPP
jgi:hypothetical protein